MDIMTAWITLREKILANRLIMRASLVIYLHSFGLLVYFITEVYAIIDGAVAEMGRSVAVGSTHLS